MPSFATLLDSFIKVGRLLWKQEVTNKQTNTRKTTDKENKFLLDKFLGSLKSHSL